jgi:hypothetical protein
MHRGGFPKIDGLKRCGMSSYEIVVGSRRARIRRNGRGEWHLSLPHRPASYSPAWLRFKTLTDASKAARLAMTVSEAPVLAGGG